MGRIFWVLMAVLGLALVLLIVNNDQGNILGIPNDTIGSTVYMGVFATVIAAALLSRRIRLGQAARQAMIWLVIVLGLMAAYIFRYEAQDLASRFTGGLVPGSPVSRVLDSGRQEVTIVRSRSGHFEVRAAVNGQPVRFLIDTGATFIVLAYDDAIAVGIDTAALSFTVPVATANGQANAAKSRIDVLTIGSISRSDQTVLVAAPGALNRSLLGVSFLQSLSSYEVRGDRMFLRE